MVVSQQYIHYHGVLARRSRGASAAPLDQEVLERLRHALGSSQQTLQLDLVRLEPIRIDDGQELPRGFEEAVDLRGRRSRVTLGISTPVGGHREQR